MFRAVSSLVQDIQFNEWKNKRINIEEITSW